MRMPLGKISTAPFDGADSGRSHTGLHFPSPERAKARFHPSAWSSLSRFAKAYNCRSYLLSSVSSAITSGFSRNRISDRLFFRFGFACGNVVATSARYELGHSSSGSDRMTSSLCGQSYTGKRPAVVGKAGSVARARCCVEVSFMRSVMRTISKSVVSRHIALR